MDPQLEKELEDYKRFAFNRNMVQVAIALLLATAFQKTVSAISDALLMPVINYFISPDGNWRHTIWHPLPGMNIEIGHLAGSFLDFLVLSLVLWLLYAHIVKRIWPSVAPDGSEQPQQPTPPPTPKVEKEVVFIEKDEDGKWRVL